MLRIILVLAALLTGCMTSDEKCDPSASKADTVHVLDTVILVEAKGEPGKLYGVWQGYYDGFWALSTPQIQKTTLLLSVAPIKDATDSAVCRCIAHISAVQVAADGSRKTIEGEFSDAKLGIIRVEWGIGAEFNLTYSLENDSLIVQQVGNGFLNTDVGVKLWR